MKYVFLDLALADPRLTAAIAEAAKDGHAVVVTAETGHAAIFDEAKLIVRARAPNRKKPEGCIERPHKKWPVRR